MASISPSNVSYGSHPFIFPSADVIFLSSNDVAFRVHKIILSLASEFFALMFTLPQPASASARSSTSDIRDIERAELDGLPLLRVPETSLVLENLFRYCYPIDDPVLNSLGKIGTTLQAAIKYDLREATKLLKERLVALVTADPLRVYAIACRYSLEDVATVAADNVLRSRTEVKYIGDMDHITAGAYYRLLHYHRNKGSIGKSWAFCKSVAVHSNRFNASDLQSAWYLPSDSSDPPTDALVCCVDSTRFKVHYTVLCLASSVLQKMFKALDETQAALGLPEDTSQRVVDITEDCFAGFVLICLCYGSDIEFDSIDKVAAALTLALNYGVKKAIRPLTRKLQSYVDAVPVQVYFIACQLGLTEVASEAAKMSLSSALEPLYYGTMEEVPAKAYHQLESYRRTCGQVATTAIDNYIKYHPTSFTSSSPSCGKEYATKSGTKPLLPCWCAAYSCDVHL
ncbi:hypothetical protein OBBRIDRAFT_798915 [Obba rivulosa]|uniref:BTB domain-containing protein n=1 Tax=Obba rivulosa TaxID=1052685 RepID=A0A8E2DF65_9APHY|nr:hypothetical protein OBBRIDRAFT_798915 [Obba rivulosa]